MANGNVATTTALVGLSGQLDTVRTEIAATNIGLQNVASLIQADSFLDQQRLLQEREQERLLAEREVRVGQEQELQKKVTAAVAPPVARLEQKLTSTFNGITNALRFLFTGFIGTTVINGFKNAAGASLKALTGIGGLIRNSFNAIGSGLSALKGGFGAVIRSITGVTSRISKAIISLAASPFKAIADVFKKFVPGVKPTGGGVPTGGGGVNLLGLLGRGLTSIGGAFGLAENIKEKDITGAFLSGASIVPSPIQLPAAIASLGYEAFGGKKLNINKTFGEMGQNITNFLGIDLNAPAKEVKGNVEEGKPSQAPASKPIQLQTVPFQAPPAATQKPNISALPEAKPDIIYTSTGQQSQSSVVSGETQTLTDVPLIPSSNPDNFYTLYAQVNYNVVM